VVPPCEGDVVGPGGRVYFERNMGSGSSIHFGRHFAWLKYFTSQLVPVLAENYKQYILSLAKVRKALAELTSDLFI
jgi:hypothetical protein